jgi:hypothetical protein
MGIMARKGMSLISNALFVSLANFEIIYDWENVKIVSLSILFLTFCELCRGSYDKCLREKLHWLVQRTVS